eukprot:COSAG01_NODE_1871_length_9009_cov_5.036139_4_plen_49_part_00
MLEFCIHQFSNLIYNTNIRFVLSRRSCVLGTGTIDNIYRVLGVGVRRS